MASCVAGGPVCVFTGLNRRSHSRTFLHCSCTEANHTTTTTTTTTKSPGVSYMYTPASQRRRTRRGRRERGGTPGETESRRNIARIRVAVPAHDAAGAALFNPCFETNQVGVVHVLSRNNGGGLRAGRLLRIRSEMFQRCGHFQILARPAAAATAAPLHAFNKLGRVTRRQRGVLLSGECSSVQCWDHFCIFLREVGRGQTLDYT